MRTVPFTWRLARITWLVNTRSTPWVDLDDNYKTIKIKSWHNNNNNEKIKLFPRPIPVLASPSPNNPHLHVLQQHKGVWLSPPGIKIFCHWKKCFFLEQKHSLDVGVFCLHLKLYSSHKIYIYLKYIYLYLSLWNNPQLSGTVSSLDSRLWMTSSSRASFWTRILFLASLAGEPSWG